MRKAVWPTLQGDALTVQPYRDHRGRLLRGGRAFVVKVADEAASNTLLASLPLLDRLLTEKIAAARRRRMEELVDFMAARMLAPSAVETEMAQRLARRRARILDDIGCFTAEQLADANGSRSTIRAALALAWRKRRRVFAVPHPDKAARRGDVYPAFQFEGGKPIKAVQDVLEAFGGRKAPWNVALWFTSSNGALPDSARPADLLIGNPNAVARAAGRDAEGSAV
ncbi:MAG TPA: hypothetical protein PKB14_23425 [Rubrivivax sp.]|nr:hypothetical protein [Rubrivivax sp.]